jgi:iron complex outermembrane recepter protein
MNSKSLAGARRALLASICMGALVLSSEAFAQSAGQTNAEAQQQPPAPEATAASNNEGQDTATGDIVVTARRTEERLQRVPASISAFNERALDRIQAVDPTSLQGAVPNLNIVPGRGSSNATNIYIRGVGQPDALQTFDPAVGVYIDDVYYSRIRGTQFDLLDIERIEVLRGPQGTLYGKNTIGGALKVITRRPGKDLRADGSIAVGSYNQFDLKGAISGPLSDTLSAGVALLRSQHDGYVEDAVLDRDYNDKNTIAARGTLSWTPSANARVDLIADYSHDDAHMNVGQPINSLTYLFGGVLLPLPSNPDPDDYDFKGRTTPGLPNSTRLTHWGVSANAAFDLTDILTFKSITAYRNLETNDYVDIDATQKEVGDVFVGVKQNQLSQEFQLALNSGPLQGIAGLYYLQENVKSHQEAYADDLIGPILANATFFRSVDDKLKTRSYAAFANSSYEIVPTVRLSAGLRYTHETKDYFRTTTTTSSWTLPPLGSLLNLTYTFNPDLGKWTDWSPMASIDWQVTPQVMLYARAAKGFKSGGFNGRANTLRESSAYKPETMLSYEAGFKSRIANQLTLNGSVFDNNYKDFQARVASTDENSLPLLAVLNAGKLRMRGAELEAAWSPVPALLIDSQIGYLHAEYKEFTDTNFPKFGNSRAFQTPAFAPKWTMRFGAQYAFGLASGGAVTVGGQARYKSRTALAVDNTFINSDVEIEGLFQPGYWVEDARIVWENSSKKLAVGLYGNNLLDKAYKTDGQEFSSVGSIRTVYYGAPRTVTLRFTARY